MILSKDRSYKLVEFNTGLIIMHSNDDLKGRPDAVPLVIADLPTLCEYLARYTDERSRGTTLQDAHNIALKGAQILELGDLDKSPN